MFTNTIRAFLFVFAFATAIVAQTSAFSYQGRLTDGGNPANGNFQMQFKLFDAVSGGGQQGSTLNNVPVTVSNGSFSVKLDFGATVFPGANRWIEVAVRRNSGETYVLLSPREQIASSPYALRTVSAALSDDSQKLGGVNANQFVQTNDTRLTDSRNPLPGSANYIQNTTSPQAASNFNIVGSGTVSSLNVAGSAAPPLAPAGQSRVYFDTAANKLRVSENGSAFVNLVGASGVSGSGTVNRLPLFSAGTTLADSNIFQSGQNIGINTTTVTFPVTLNATGHGFVQTDGTVQVGSYVSGLGGWLGTRSNHPLHFFTNNSAPLMTLTATGNLGIGTFTPNTRLTLNGGAPWTSFAWTASMNLQNSSALGWEANASGQRFGVGQTGGGLYFFRTSSGFGGTSTPPIYEMAITDAGNVGIGTTAPTHKLDVFGFFRAVHPAGGNVVSETTGGVNAWAKLWVKTPVQLWSVGSSNTFNGNQLYFANETAGTIPMAIMPNGNVGIGTTNPGSRLDVVGTTKTGVLQITGGSDLAENFEIDDAGSVQPGMLVAISPQLTEKLVIARGAYNRNVVGIISGANGLAAGMLLPDPKKLEGTLPVALSGRAWVYADASKHSIRPGDLLTTSDTPGHAMRVRDHKRAAGAVIGKAMTELRSGTGLVLVFVTLQ